MDVLGAQCSVCVESQSQKLLGISTAYKARVGPRKTL
jgi:hypothetical protein